MHTKLVLVILLLCGRGVYAQSAVQSPHQPRSAALSTIATNGAAYYLNRANHTGTQLLSTISDAGDLAALDTVTSAKIEDLTIVSGDIANGTIARGKLDPGAYSTGGNWTADSGKLVQFQNNGEITATSSVTAVATTGTWKQSGQVKPDGFLFQNVGGVSGRFFNFIMPAISGSRAVYLPSESGTLARVEDITPAQLTQSGATTGQGIVWNGTAWAPGTVGGALTVGTTDVASGASGHLMYETSGNKLGEISGVTSDGASLLFSSSATLSWNSDTYVARKAAATLQVGQDVNADAADQVIKAADGVTGTNRNGGDLTMASGNSTGTGTSAVTVKTPAAGSSGTTAHTAVERLRIDSTGVWIENTTAPASNPAAGSFILYVDPADNTLRARGSSGTITILANP